MQTLHKACKIFLWVWLPNQVNGYKTMMELLLNQEERLEILKNFKHKGMAIKNLH